MQPLAAEKRFDPAPSRISYRAQRLWLTPLVRRLLRFGVPSILVLGIGLWFISDAERVEDLRESFVKVQQSIENRPEFMVNLMRIDGISEEVAEDIREVTALDFPVSSFDLNLEDMRVQIEELDAVASADVVVRPGGVLNILVTERLPAIIWRGPQELELLDDAGHRVQALPSRQSRPDLALIAGAGADRAVPEALQLLASAAPISTRLRGLLRVGERRWDLILDRNQRIMLPEKGAVLALEHALALNEINDILARDVIVVDLRDPSRPMLRLSTNAVTDLRRQNDPTSADDEI